MEPPDFCAHLAQYEGGPCSTAKKRCGTNAVSLHTANLAVKTKERRLLRMALRSHVIWLWRQHHATRCITVFAVQQVRPLILRQMRAEIAAKPTPQGVTRTACVRCWRDAMR